MKLLLKDINKNKDEIPEKDLAAYLTMLLDHSYF